MQCSFCPPLFDALKIVIQCQRQYNNAGMSCCPIVCGSTEDWSFARDKQVPGIRSCPRGAESDLSGTCSRQQRLVAVSIGTFTRVCDMRSSRIRSASLIDLAFGTVHGRDHRRCHDFHAARAGEQTARVGLSGAESCERIMNGSGFNAMTADHCSRFSSVGGSTRESAGYFKLQPELTLSSYPRGAHARGQTTGHGK